MKRDATTGEIICPGQRYRTHYRGTPHECYSLVTEKGEQATADYLRRNPEHADRVPPIEVMTNTAPMAG